MTLGDAYLDLRRAVDFDLRTRRRPLSLYGPGNLLMLGIGDLAVTDLMWVPLVVAGTGLSAAALAFAGWRASRLMRAGALLGDRSFDRTTRFMLSSDYRDTESATKARVRKRSRRARSTRAEP